MPRNQSERDPFPNVNPRFVERLRLYGKQASVVKFVSQPAHMHRFDEANDAYWNFVVNFTPEERGAYADFRLTLDYLALRKYWMDRYGSQ